MFDLPEPTRYNLDSPPLRQAHAEIRFPLVARYQTLEGVADLQASLSDIFPFMERRDTAEMGIKVGPDGPGKPEVGTSTGWELSNEEGLFVSLGPSTACLTAAGDYRGVEWFIEHFAALLSALTDAGDIRRVDRFGLRFINIAEAPVAEPRKWVDWFTPNIVGWASSGPVSESASLLTSFTQSILTVDAADAFDGFEGDVQSIIRNGLVQAGSVVPGIPPIQLDQEAFILDLDVALVTPQPFAKDAVLAEFRELHRELDKFFRWSLSDDGARHFGLREVSS